MTELSAEYQALANYRPTHKVRFVTAASLFDGHDAEAVDQARSRWKAEKAAGHDITYWQQKPGGGWERKA